MGRRRPTASATRLIKAHVPAEWSQAEGWVTVWLPGFLIDDRRLAVTEGTVSYRFDPETWRHDFPNIDEQPVDTFVVTLSASGRDQDGQRRIRVRDCWLSKARRCGDCIPQKRTTAHFSPSRHSCLNRTSSPTITYVWNCLVLASALWAPEMRTVWPGGTLTVVCSVSVAFRGGSAGVSSSVSPAGAGSKRVCSICSSRMTWPSSRILGVVETSVPVSSAVRRGYPGPSGSPAERLGPSAGDHLDFSQLDRRRLEFQRREPYTSQVPEGVGVASVADGLLQLLEVDLLGIGNRHVCGELENRDFHRDHSVLRGDGRVVLSIGDKRKQQQTAGDPSHDLCLPG